jgi:putative endonuclease
MPSSKKPTPNRRNRVSTGRSYERLAARYLEQQGFEVLERNWRAGPLEIDLIVHRGDLLVFVEVKAANTKSFGHPATWVDSRKVEHLTQAARRYIIDKNIEGCDFRFELVTFTGGELEHYPGAFTADS